MSLAVHWQTDTADRELPYFSYHLLNQDIERLNESYRLRYDVYCNELKFLETNEYPHQTETDEFDAGSVHIGAVNQEDALIANARLVPCTRDKFPLDNHCEVDSNLVSKSLGITAEELRLSSAVEISRLVIAANYRRRRGDGMYAMNPGYDRRGKDRAEPGRRGSADKPMLTMGLYKTIYQVSRVLGIKYWLAAMEPVLARCLRQQGIRFHPIGPDTDYYGIVRPYGVKLDEVFQTVQEKSPERAKEWLQRPAHLYEELGFFDRRH